MKLEVPGASLHWQQRGEGPVLLVLQGGDGDADASALLAERLEGYRIVTLDRRGLSRSTLNAPAGLELSTHTADALAVLGAATAEPAFVFGTSIGALIGLELLARAPQRVRRLVAHEPPLTQLLPDAEREPVDRGREEIEATLRSQGVLPAMRKFFVGTGVDPMDREPDVPGPAPSSARLLNLKFFLEHDAPAARQFILDVALVKPHAAKVVVGAGVKTRGHWLHRCSELLAQALGVPLTDFPGGHGGYVNRPRGFAEVLQTLLR
ncbi:MAG: alpha/beta fold hydrolase [Archangiaceae bacterium]|nr:alpha/beta fold hydrolase [Archangiaceae bacterium]